MKALLTLIASIALVQCANGQSCTPGVNCGGQGPTGNDNIPPIIQDLTDSVRSLQQDMASVQQAVRDLGNGQGGSNGAIINELRANMTRLSKRQDQIFSIVQQVQRDLELLKRRFEALENPEGGGQAPVTTASPRPAAAKFPDVCTATESDYEGPFYKPGYPQVQLLCPNDKKIREELLTVYGYVTTTSCQPIAYAKIELWQADSDSNYVDDCRGFVVSDSNGYYRFSTVMPGLYYPRPKHVHFRVTSGNTVLITQLYFAGTNPPGRLPSNTMPLASVDVNHQATQYNVAL